MGLFGGGLQTQQKIEFPASGLTGASNGLSVSGTDAVLGGAAGSGDGELLGDREINLDGFSLGVVFDFGANPLNKITFDGAGLNFDNSGVVFSFKNEGPEFKFRDNSSANALHTVTNSGPSFTNGWGNGTVVANPNSDIIHQCTLNNGAPNAYGAIGNVAGRMVVTRGQNSNNSATAAVVNRLKGAAGDGDFGVGNNAHSVYARQLFIEAGAGLSGMSFNTVDPAQYVRFMQTDTERARFADDGSFLIGRTVSEGSQFVLQIGNGGGDVRTLLRAASNYALAIGNATGNDPVYIGASAGGANSDLLFSDNGGAEIGRVLSSGGYAAPYAKGYGFGSDGGDIIGLDGDGVSVYINANGGNIFFDLAGTATAGSFGFFDSGDNGLKLTGRVSTDNSGLLWGLGDYTDIVIPVASGYITVNINGSDYRIAAESI